MCNSDVRNVSGMKTFVFVFSQKVQSLSRKCDRKRNLVFFARNIFLIEILRENIFVLISLMVLKAEVTFTWLIQRLEPPAHPIPPPTPPIPHLPNPQPMAQSPPVGCKTKIFFFIFSDLFLWRGAPSASSYILKSKIWVLEGSWEPWWWWVVKNVTWLKKFWHFGQKKLRP